MKIICKMSFSALLSIVISILLLTSIDCYAEDESVKEIMNADRGTDIVMVVDNSESMWDKQQIRNNAMITAANLAVGADVRIGVVYFAEDVYKYYNLADLKDEKSFRRTSANMKMTDHGENSEYKNIGKGLMKGIELFENQDENRRRIILLITDGENGAYNKTDNNFKKKANELTKKQVQIIKDKNIDLYCVSIKEKENDENYLRQLVNYFGSEKNNESTRFFSVNENNINELYDRIIEIFYSLRGDVKYIRISPDDKGVFSFSIPKLGVKKMQLYVNNATMNAVLEGPDKKALPTKWKDDNSQFLTVESPAAGNWRLSLKPVEQAISGKIRPTLALYIDLMASATVKPSEGDDLVKGKNAYIETAFYDENKNFVVIDEIADVTAELTFSNNGKVLKKENFKLRPEGEHMISEGFELTDFGQFSVDLDVTYSDEIFLKYQIPIEKKVEPFAPKVIKSFEQDNVRVEKVNKADGTVYQFSIPLNEYIQDQDSQFNSLRVTQIKQNNDHNPLKAYIDNDMLVVETEKCESFSGYVELTDENGMKTELGVKGSMMDMDFWSVLLKIIILIIAVAIGCFVILMILRKKWIVEILEIEEKIEEYKTNSNTIKSEDFESDSDKNAYDQLISSVNVFVEKADEDEAIRKYLRSDIIGEENENYVQQIADEIDKSEKLFEEIIRQNKAISRIISNQADYSQNALKSFNWMKLRSIYKEFTKLYSEFNLKKEEIDSNIKRYNELSDSIKKYKDTLNNKSEKIKKRLDNYKNCKSDFAIKMIINENQYLYSQKNAFIIRPRNMSQFFGSTADNLKNSNAVFMVYREEVIVEENTITVSGIKILIVDDEKVDICGKIAKGSEGSYNDTQLGLVNLSL